MKSPLWSKALGVVLGILIGAGATYAAIQYSYHVEAAATVEVGEGPDQYEPGLEITPTSLDFGKIYPDTGPGSDHISAPVALNVTNIGDTAVSLSLTFDNVPQGLSIQEDSANSHGSSDGTEPNTVRIHMSGRAWVVAPGETYVLYPYVIASSDISPGMHEFKAIVDGG